MQAHQISMENKYSANQLQQQYQRKVESYHTSCGVTSCGVNFGANLLHY